MGTGRGGFGRGVVGARGDRPRGDRVVSRPRLLDLFCGAGGAAAGYARAGFEVVGVDLAPQPHYPYAFIRADALEVEFGGFDAIHASPPCQHYSRLRHLTWLRDRETWDSVPPTLERLERSGLPWVLENVEGAPVDGISLCGTMFGLVDAAGDPIYRHRRFASSEFMLAPGHPAHARARVRRGKNASGTSRINDGTVVAWRTGGALMGIDWMTQDELAQSVPPAYTEWLGARLLEAVARVA
jgi:DNA (cytosine-5)-methyltransferase 1